MRSHTALARILIFVLLLVAALHAQGDVYAINVDGGKWRYWKNGKEVQAFDYDGFSIGSRCQYRGATYRTVRYNTEQSAVDKNDSKLHYLTDATDHVKTITVSLGDVYVGGLEKNSQGEDIAVVWKNGSVLYRLTDGNAKCNVVALAVSGGNVYAGGYEKDSDGVPVAMVWKNGRVLYRLTEGSAVLSLAVSDGDVYAGGRYNSVGYMPAIVWKNGRLLHRLNSSGAAIAKSLFVQGGDVYAGGVERNAQGTWVAKVWKNGETLYRLNDSSEAASHLVFVAKPKLKLEPPKESENWDEDDWNDWIEQEYGL